MKAVIIAGRYTTDCEFVYPFHRLKEDGWDVDVAVRGKPDVVLSDLGGKIVPTCDIPTAADYDLLILPGGAKAMEYMRQDMALLGFIAAHHRQGGVIGCICHGAQLLISAGLVKGRRISGYYSIKDDIMNAGGIYHDCDLAPHFVEQDGICTTSHYKHLGPWMKEVLRVARESL